MDFLDYFYLLKYFYLHHKYSILFSVSTSSSVRGNDSETTSISTVKVETRRRGFSDCPQLPPIGCNRINKRGPLTVGSSSNSANFNAFTSGIAEHDREERDRGYEQFPSRTYVPPSVRGDYYAPSSGSVSRRGFSGRRNNMDTKSAIPSHYSGGLGGLISLQTCSHPVYSVSPPLATGWYKGNEGVYRGEDEHENGRSNGSGGGNSEGKKAGGGGEGNESDGSTGIQGRAMEIVEGDETNNSQNYSKNDSYSCTPTSHADDDTTVITSGFTRMASSSKSFPPSIISGEDDFHTHATVGDAREYAVDMNGAMITTTSTTTAYSTPDMTPLHSPYR